MTRPPVLFIARIAGLPAEALESFGSRELVARIEESTALEAKIEEYRSRIVDSLFGAINGAPKDVRRALLGAKRDAFNQRSIRLALDDPAWRHAPEAKDLAQELAELEREAAKEEQAIEESARSTRYSERRRLLARLEDRELARGITLSSPDWWKASRRLRKRPVDRWRRKERSLEHSLLRFVSRAAAKLSPYSTLTTLGLGQTGAPAGTPPRLVGEEWSRRSILRLKRFLLDQALTMASAHPDVRGPLIVGINETVRRVKEGRYRLLRPGFWKVDPDRRELRYFQDSFVAVNVDDQWMERLHGLLDRDPIRWRDFVTFLAADEGDEPDAEALQTTEKLLDPWLSTGLLQLHWPWPSNTPHLEKVIVEYFSGLEGTPAIARLTDVFERLAELETAWPSSEDGIGVLAEIDDLLVELRTRAATVGGIAPESVDFAPSAKGNYYEDVFVADRTGGDSGGAVLEVSRESLDSVFREMDPLIRLSYLYNHRHDFLASLAHFMDSEWPERGAIPLLEVFRRAQPLWKESTSYQREKRGARGGRFDAFNPYELSGIARLADFKKRLWGEIGAWIDTFDDEIRIDPRKLSKRLEELPPGYRPAVGPCLLLQPIDKEGDRWVLNRMYEGVGRYASRFTAAMEEPERERYVEHFERHGFGELPGGEAALLDIVRPQGDILNVHAMQTPFALDFPGERSSISAECRRTLDQLYLSVEPNSGYFDDLATVRVTDHRGQQLLPTHLGNAGPYVMPPLIKFLITLGVGEILPIYPERPANPRGRAVVRDRLTLGERIVLQRKRWIFPSREAPSHVVDLSEERAFVELNRWRIEQGLPERLFLQEVVSHFVLPDRYKPQYIDFSSPAFVSLLVSCLKEEGKNLVFEEALPDLPAWLSGIDGEFRAVELQVDRLSFGPQGTDRPILRAHRRDASEDRSTAAVGSESGGQTIARSP